MPTSSSSGRLRVEALSPLPTRRKVVYPRARRRSAGALVDLPDDGILLEARPQLRVLESGDDAVDHAPGRLIRAPGGVGVLPLLAQASHRRVGLPELPGVAQGLGQREGLSKRALRR